MGRRKIVLSGLLTAAVVGALALAMAAQKNSAPLPRAHPGPPPASIASERSPVLWHLPAFSFTDQNGRTVTDASLRGHLVIANFVFTSCTTICPLITAKMALLQRRLTDPDLRFVSFSVDPKNDTPEAMKRYAGEWRPDETRWLLLSTTPPALDALASRMFVSVKPVENDIAHTNLFFLVDAEGGVRGIYESDRDDAVQRLTGEVESLVSTAKGKSTPPDEATDGAGLYRSLGCGACHARTDLAPPLEGLLGRRVGLEGGVELRANSAYVRESIIAPEAKLIPGFALRMPSYGRALTPRELDALVDYVGGLTAPATSSKPNPTPPAPSAAPAVVTDPVCSMSVRVTDKTPRASHAGKSYYFCSDMCRERFVKDPAHFVKPGR